METSRLTASEILQLFSEVSKRARSEGREYRVLRVSGGEPFLVPDLIAELLKAVGENAEQGDKEFYPSVIWTETNLMPWVADERNRWLVDAICREAVQAGLDVRRIFSQYKDRLIIHPCFHGLTDENISGCIGSREMGVPAPTFRDLVDGFKRLHQFAGDASLNIYPTFIAEACNPDGIQELFRELWGTSKKYPLKLAVISADFYEPVQRRIKERSDFKVYSRHASLARWNTLLRECFDVEYGRLPRPLSDHVADTLGRVDPRSVRELSPYEPMLVLLKSTYRDDYRQELLSLIAAPPDTEFTATYDRRHVEPSTLLNLKAGVDKLGDASPKALIVYSNPNAGPDEVSFLPLRIAVLKGVKVSEQFVYIEIIVGDYVLPRAADAEQELNRLKAFEGRMLEYYGRANLRMFPERRWVLLGEIALLRGWDPNLPSEFEFPNAGEKNGRRFETLSKSWDRIVHLVETTPGLTELANRSIFLQVLAKNYAVGSAGLSQSFAEGEVASYQLRHYIPDFAYYEGKGEDDSRTVNVSTTESPLVVEGYNPKPLGKYGEVDFRVRCDKLENDNTPAHLLVRSKNLSCYCPSIQIDFQLKKA